jgi:hypothetical protein
MTVIATPSSKRPSRIVIVHKDVRPSTDFLNPVSDTIDRWRVRNRKHDIEKTHLHPPLHRRIDHGREGIIDPSRFHKGVLYELRLFCVFQIHLRAFLDSSVAQIQLGAFLDTVSTADDEYDALPVCVKALDGNTVAIHKVCKNTRDGVHVSSSSPAEWISKYASKSISIQ